MRLYRVPLLVLALLASDTEAAPPAPAATPVAATPAAPPDPLAYARGAKAWAETCTRCHAVRDPRQFSDRQWPIITNHMRLRAGLDGAQIRDITLFLQGSN